jgi:uncharacterized phiE125 gp8 family phage protein
MAGLTLVTLPTDEPVSLEDALLYARYEAGVEDALFESLINLGRQQVENITEHQLNEATFIQYFDGFPVNRCFLLSKPPLISVTSVKYLDADGAEQTIDPSNYIVHSKNQHRGIVQFKKDYSFPTVRDEQIDSVFIEFVCGYENWSAEGVPETLKTAIKLFVNDVWSHREYQLDGTVTGSIQDNTVAKQILNNYRVFTPAGIGVGSEIPQFIR